MTQDPILERAAAIFCCTLTIISHLNKTGETGLFCFGDPVPDFGTQSISGIQGGVT
jgi:hypothetical protein